jgi:hypothetical protein
MKHIVVPTFCFVINNQIRPNTTVSHICNGFPLDQKIIEENNCAYFNYISSINLLR